MNEDKKKRRKKVQCILTLLLQLFILLRCQHIHSLNSICVFFFFFFLLLQKLEQICDSLPLHPWNDFTAHRFIWSSE